jgi:hypothetical protein
VYEVRIPFVRGGGVVEKGHVSILVNNIHDTSEIEHTLSRGNFKSFLVTDREYIETEWNFGKVEDLTNDNEDNPDSA